MKWGRTLRIRMEVEMTCRRRTCLFVIYLPTNPATSMKSQKAKTKLSCDSHSPPSSPVQKEDKDKEARKNRKAERYRAFTIAFMN